jgi:hypothetical protein
MKSVFAKIAVLIFILFSLVSCVVIRSGPPRPRPHYAVWVNGYWGPHGHWVPGHWAVR